MATTAAAESEKLYWTGEQRDAMSKELMIMYGVLAASLGWFYAMPLVLPPWAHLMVLAVMSVLIGCKHHLLLSRGVKESVEGKVTVTSEAEETESMGEGDAYMFPVYGSCVLFGLFLVFKFLNKDWVKYLLMLYVVFMCVGGLGKNLADMVALGVRTSKKGLELPLIGMVTYLEMVCLVVAAGVGAAYVASDRHWALNNLMGVSFCLVGMKLINLNSYKIGIIMFCGLFVYDVFWVFGSKSVFGDNVMVTVAKGLNAPIKLMFPRAPIPDDPKNPEQKMQFSMLGLGDIVVPGLFLSVIIHLDAKLNPSGSRVYFNVAMVAYALSLATTVFVMVVFEAAQPALLYIVPYIVVATLATALVRGEMSTMWAFECEPENDAKKNAEAAAAAAAAEKKDDKKKQ